MSSIYVRDQIKKFVADNAPTESLVDLTAQYGEIREFLEDVGVTTDAWLGVDFLADDEVPITIPATNEQGRYRETGAIFFHVVDTAKLGIGNALLTRGENLRNLFRGRRIGRVVIDSVAPMAFGPGATLQFEGGFMSGSFICSYTCDSEL